MSHAEWQERMEAKIDFLISSSRTLGTEQLRIRRIVESGSIVVPIAVSLVTSLIVGAAMWGCQ